MKRTKSESEVLFYKSLQFLLDQQRRFNHHIHEIHCRQAAHWRNDTTGSGAPACNCGIGKLITRLQAEVIRPVAGSRRVEREG